MEGPPTTLDPSIVHTPSQKGTTSSIVLCLMNFGTLVFLCCPLFFLENQGAAFPVEQTWWSHFKVQTGIILRWLDSEQHIWKCVLYMWHQHFCHTSLRTYAQYFSPLFDQKSQFHLRNWSLDTWSTSEFICYAAMLSTNSYSLGFGRLEWLMFLTKVALRLGDSHRFARIDCSFPRVVAEPWLDRRRNSSLKKPTSVGIYWKLLGWTWVTRDPFQTAHEHPWYFSPFRFMKNIDFKYALPSVPLLVAGCSRMRGCSLFLGSHVLFLPPTASFRLSKA